MPNGPAADRAWARQRLAQSRKANQSKASPASNAPPPQQSVPSADKSQADDAAKPQSGEERAAEPRDGASKSSGDGASKSGAADAPSSAASPATNAPPIEKGTVPYDETPKASPGERITLRAEFTHANPSAYQLVYTGVGGSIDNAATKTIAGLKAENVNFVIKSPWPSVVTLRLDVKNVASGAIEATKSWSFSEKTAVPDYMHQREGEGEYSNPATYHYELGKQILPGQDTFVHNTIAERFEQNSCDITIDEIKPEYRTAHPYLTTMLDINNHFFGTGPGNTSTFVVQKGDVITDTHVDGFPSLATLQSALVKMREVHSDLPQIYESKPGTTLGRYIIRRIVKADGTPKIRKMKAP